MAEILPAEIRGEYENTQPNTGWTTVTLADRTYISRNATLSTAINQQIQQRHNSRQQWKQQCCQLL